uniref:ATP synthase F0 subunit 8 n=1 Tax=Sternaspis buzhinskajae TaxID=2931363 RepID=A0A9E8G3X8_9ANNE|nr:ATP synthase F0 subunit 8 [Sternaspis buzhinskajae]
MPHISPILWTQSLLIFWLLLASILLLLWWHQPPQFPKLMSNSSFSLSQNWKWN